METSGCSEGLWLVSSRQLGLEGRQESERDQQPGGHSKGPLVMHLHTHTPCIQVRSGAWDTLLFQNLPVPPRARMLPENSLAREVVRLQSSVRKPGLKLLSFVGRNRKQIHES